MEDVYAMQKQTSPAHLLPKPDSPRIAKRAGAGVGLRAGRGFAFELGMGRPKGSRNKRTLLKEAEQHVGSKYVDQVLDSLYVIEMATRHFFIRAEMGKNVGRKKEEVDEDYKQAAALTALVAPYRHARLSAVKLTGDRTIRCISGMTRRRTSSCRDHEATGNTDLCRAYRLAGAAGANSLLRTVSISAPRANALCQTVPASISAKADV